MADKEETGGGEQDDISFLRTVRNSMLRPGLSFYQEYIRNKYVCDNSTAKNRNPKNK